MKKLILITASICGCLILATALALPLGVLVREWSSHIVAGDIELPKDKRSVEKEAEPLEPHKPDIVEELKPVDTAEQLESLESSEGKERCGWKKVSRNALKYDRGVMSLAIEPGHFFALGGFGARALLIQDVVDDWIESTTNRKGIDT